MQIYAKYADLFESGLANLFRQLFDTIKITTTNIHKIDRELLMEQGVPEAVIDQATLINKSREHIRVNHIKDLPVKTIQAESETGVQIPNKEDDQANTIRSCLL